MNILLCSFVGETLQDATNAGRQTFGVATTLLLVCLPTNGAATQRLPVSTFSDDYDPLSSASQ